MTIAVTGASGFVGSHLTPALKKSGYNVLPVDRSHGFDVVDYNSLQQLPDFDVLIHLAARAFVPDSYKTPHNFYTTNVNGTLNVLELSRIRKAKLIFISSYVYGKPDYLPIDEMHPLKPFNPYAQSKILGEQLCLAYVRDFQMPIHILRPFNIYGDGQSQDFLISKLISGAIKQETIYLFDSRPKRDFVYVEDVVDALIKTIQLQSQESHIINIGYGESHSVAEVCKVIEQLAEYKLDVRFSDGDYRPQEIMDVICNNTKARDILDWKPSFSLHQGLEHMLYTARTIKQN